MNTELVALPRPIARYAALCRTVLKMVLKTSIKFLVHCLSQSTEVECKIFAYIYTKHPPSWKLNVRFRFLCHFQMVNEVNHD